MSWRKNKSCSPGVSGKFPGSRTAVELWAKMKVCAGMSSLRQIVDSSSVEENKGEGEANFASLNMALMCALYGFSSRQDCACAATAHTNQQRKLYNSEEAMTGVKAIYVYGECRCRRA